MGSAPFTVVYTVTQGPLGAQVQLTGVLESCLRPYIYILMYIVLEQGQWRAGTVAGWEQ